MRAFTGIILTIFGICVVTAFLHQLHTNIYLMTAATTDVALEGACFGAMLNVSIVGVSFVAFIFPGVVIMMAPWEMFSLENWRENDVDT